MKITKRFIEKVKEAIKLNKEYEHAEFYNATDDFRWGHANRTKLDDTIITLKEMLILMMINDGKTEKEATKLVEHMDILSYSKDLAGLK